MHAGHQMMTPATTESPVHDHSSMGHGGMDHSAMGHGAMDHSQHGDSSMGHGMMHVSF